jgi:hypothetical protein
MAAQRNLSGGCTCGAVRYVAKADPILMLNCHCRDCQRASGSAFAPLVVVPKGSLEIRGELRYHAVVGGSGTRVERGFCPTCGNPVAIKLARMPDIIGVMASSLDEPALHTPSVEIFTASAHPWDHMAPDTRKIAHGLSPQPT